MATHSSVLAWRIPGTEETGRLQSIGRYELDTTERLHFHFSLSCFGGGNGNPLQDSCLENPRYGGAWWAAVSGVTQSRTRLKQLSSSSSRSYKMDGTWGSLNHWVEEGHLPIRISALDFFFFFFWQMRLKSLYLQEFKMVRKMFIFLLHLYIIITHYLELVQKSISAQNFFVI